MSYREYRVIVNNFFFFKVYLVALIIMEANMYCKVCARYCPNPLKQIIPQLHLILTMISKGQVQLILSLAFT